MEKQLQTIEQVKDFLAWVEDQPSDKTYNYFECSNCAAAQYLHTKQGFEDVMVGSSYYTHMSDCAKVLFIEDLCDVILGDEAERDNSTFGSLAARLRDFIDSQ